VGICQCLRRVSLGIGISLNLEVNDNIEASVYGGGEGTLSFQVPKPYFQGADFRLFVGARASLWGFEISDEASFNWPTEQAGTMTAHSVRKGASFGPILRHYDRYGRYSRFAAPSKKMFSATTSAAGTETSNSGTKLTLMQNIFSEPRPALAVSPSDGFCCYMSTMMPPSQ